LDLESYFISQFHTKYIGDDAAVVSGFIYSKDAFFEGVHFKKEWMSYKQIAQKAMLVNISDAVAMNAKPLYALLSVAMPKDITKHDAKALADGFKEVSQEYGIEIIGGDTIANTKLDITITIISKSKRPLYRKGMKKGDLVAYTGILGSSAKDLKKLFYGGKISKNSKFFKPQLRSKFLYSTRRYLHCGMDISDGLFSDLEKLSQSNNLGFSFMKKLPKKSVCSGEEYEMLFSFDKRYKTAIIRQAKRTRTKINIFATVQNKKFRNTCKRHHF